MKTDVGLKALGKPFQNTVHVDSVRIRPRVLEIFLQTLTERIRDLMESYKLSDPEHLRVIPRGTAIQPLNDRRYIAEDAGVHQG